MGRIPRFVWPTARRMNVAVFAIIWVRVHGSGLGLMDTWIAVCCIDKIGILGLNKQSRFACNHLLICRY